MPYRVEIGSKADAQLTELDPAIGAGVERKIQWLAENAAVMVHRRLVGMPEDLAGLCKLRVGDYRVLYWNYPDQKLVRIYRIQHRSEVYRRL
ncbi:MAG: type II toxin-antitoxin system RelE/ParE family toxin [Chthoniobacteraceae bacterium]|jgi:mRNA interferase RelE/StbE